MTITHQGRHRYSLATTTLLTIFIFSRYQLEIDAFQLHSHCVAIPTTPFPLISAQRLPAQKQQHFAQADDDSSEIQEPAVSSYIVGNDKKILSKAYTIGQYLFLLTAVLHLYTVRPAGIFLESDFARSTEWGAAAGFGVAAGVSYILKGAVDHDRLNSDTYKRLSVGLLGFCLLGMAAVPGEAAFVAVPGPAAVPVLFTVLVRLYGTALSFVGWKRGVIGVVNGSGSDRKNTKQGLPRIMQQEFATGMLETVKGLHVRNAKKALTYRNCLLLVVAGMFSNFMEGVFNLRVSTV